MSKKLWFQCLKSMVFATLASLGALIVCAIVIAAALNSIGSRTFGNIAICIIIMAAYAVFLTYSVCAIAWILMPSIRTNLTLKKN